MKNEKNKFTLEEVLSERVLTFRGASKFFTRSFFLKEVGKMMKENKIVCELNGMNEKAGIIFKIKSGTSDYGSDYGYKRYSRENIENNVGRLWHFLNDNGKSSERKCCERLGLQLVDLWIAEGWLSHENKLGFDKGLFLI